MSRGAPFNLRSTTVHWPHVACNGHLRRCPKEVGRGSLSNTYSKQTSVPISIFWSATAVHALLATRTDPPTGEWERNLHTKMNEQWTRRQLLMQFALIPATMALPGHNCVAEILPLLRRRIGSEVRTSQ